MSLLLAALLAAAPAEGSRWKLELRVHEAPADRKIPPRTFGGELVARVEALKGGQPTAVSLEPAPKGRLPAFTVREDSGAAVVAYAAGSDKVLLPQEAAALRFFASRLVLPDAERGAMASCGEGHAPAVERWLARSIAAAYAVAPGEVTVSEAKVKCAVVKGAARHAVSFKVAVPRGLLRLSAELKGTITVDPSVWVTQWAFSGPTVMAGEGLGEERSVLSTSLTVAPKR